MLRVVKPKSRRARRIIEARAPKLHENTKKTVLLHGAKTSVVIKEALSDLYSLKKPGGNAVQMTHKNDKVRPFEGGGETSLEFLAQKTDCSLFAFGSHSKKRPHNLVLGRMFDFHVLDMVELGVDKYVSVRQLGGGGKFAPQIGSKPCVVFAGGEWEGAGVGGQLKSLLLDFFRGEEVGNLNLAGLDRVFICVLLGSKVYIRHAAIRLKKSGSKVPRIELVPAGPCMDFTIRRTRQPAADLMKEAMKAPKLTAKKKVKNVSTDSILGKVGRVYMPRQEVEKVAFTKMKGLKRERRERAAEKAEGKPGLNARVTAKAARGAGDVKPKAKRLRIEE